MSLNLNANIPNPDNFYNRLIDMQRDLSEEEVQMMNAKLILLLANHIGEESLLFEAMDLAKPIHS
ncbi:DUF2783 domain-containing protein [Pseudoteredinibacter isoporae]|uniref:DUF2783 domain-containing protein n=1 Tax=Pseudoteredinibacter isoporae TaxID=570281 RepID=A0A7X0MUA5_9GAMM|nr:DUF2783 domain-containing protein [Pseudoteredinibacter isoporae]MBB6520068.1 hypothetical protein [Pseudoteredinibacter isoporae]NHO85640.1 DUF2783 domain-containing protein [Pseudoteredinibacter isoporae]NIB25908.1 DUF2783 domain-containing protein [Pseudoteredinibacter isoporae]